MPKILPKPESAEPIEFSRFSIIRLGTYLVHMGDLIQFVFCRATGPSICVSRIEDIGTNDRDLLAIHSRLQERWLRLKDQNPTIKWFCGADLL